MLDFTPVMHTIAAIMVQCIFGFLSEMWFIGGAFGCIWFIAREHTQAEYRWIAMFGNGKRANMPWWGGFDLRAWNAASLLDCLVPVVGCAMVGLVVHQLA